MSDPVPAGAAPEVPTIKREDVITALSPWALEDNPIPFRALAAIAPLEGDLGRLVRAILPELDREEADPMGAADRLQKAGEPRLAWLLRELVNEVTRRRQAEIDARLEQTDSSAGGLEEERKAQKIPLLVRVADVASERVEWLWSQRIPLGKVTVLDGDPGLGKSTVTLDIAARVSCGAPMHGETQRREPAGVVLLSAEDGIADTIRPRLEAAGADLSRVVVLKAIKESDGKERPPLLPDDVLAIREAVLETDARFVVIDPLMAFLAGRIDAHRDQDIRAALHLVARLAEETGAAVLIIRHLNKTPGGNALYRGSGSIGIIGAARVGLLVAPDPKDESRRILAVTKSNLGPVPPSLAFRIVTTSEASAVSWEGEVEYAARDLLSQQDDDGGLQAEAEAFLRDLLADGPMPQKKVMAEGEQAGFKEKALRKAARKLGIKPKKMGMSGGWIWPLPTPKDAQPPPEDAEDAQRGHLRRCPSDAEDAQPQKVGIFGDPGHLRQADEVEGSHGEVEGTWIQ